MFRPGLSAPAATIRALCTRVLGGTMRRTVVLFAAACLALAGCSSGGEPEKTVTATVTESPSLSAAEARAACVDAWAEWFEEAPDDYDPDVDPLPELAECEGLSGQAEMGVEALQRRNEANREELDACLEDPSCTSLPIP